MRSRSNQRLFRSVILAASVTPIALAAVANAAIYNTPPITVYTAASSGFNTLTDGFGSSSTPSNLSQQETGAIAGYDVLTGTSRSLYYFNESTNSASTVVLSDGLHLNNTLTPTLAMVSSSGTLLGTQVRSGNGSNNDGTDVFYSVGGTAPVVVPAPSSVLGSNASYSYTSTSDGYTVQQLIASSPTDSPAGINTNAIEADGVIAGTVTRYAGNSYTARSSLLGNDGFYYNPGTGTTTAIGLSGAQYEYTPSSITDTSLKEHATFVVGMGNGAAFGFTQRFDGTSAGNSLGFDSWMYAPSLGNVQIGLTGGVYSSVSGGNTYEETQLYRSNSLGQVAGKTNVPVGSTLSGTTNVAFLYTPSATPGTSSSFGTSSVGTYAQLGFTTLPSGSTLGYYNPSLSTNLHSFTNIYFLNNQGHAAGASNRYDSSGNFEGQGAWYFDGTNNIDISPTDSIHAAVAGGVVASTNAITAINNAGLVGGDATRVAGTATGSASPGQDAYIYDDNTHTEYYVDPTDEAMGISNYELSYVGMISDGGIAIGYYNTYSGATSSTITGCDLFAWSETNGLQILGTYPTSQSGNMANFVSSFEFAADGTLYGPSAPSATPSALVEYTLVPEPSTLGLLLAACSVGLVRRHRRSA